MQGGKAVEVSKMGHPSLDEVTNILTVERWCWKQFIDEEPSASLECWSVPSLQCAQRKQLGLIGTFWPKIESFKDLLLTHTVLK